MNIMEAVGSSKQFKRKNSTKYYFRQDGPQYFTFSIDDLLADDWEVRDISFMVTEGELHKALSDYFNNHEVTRQDVVENLRKGDYK
jgi:hypothetical protein